MLDTAKLGAACRAQGCLLALDVSQSCGGIPMNVETLGADFITCSGYKWLLGPYGTGFFWARGETMASFRPSPFYWQGIAGLAHYGDLIFENPKAEQGARGWDASETASYFNLAGWDASLKFLREVGVETVADAQSRTDRATVSKGCRLVDVSGRVLRRWSGAGRMAALLRRVWNETRELYRADEGRKTNGEFARGKYSRVDTFVQHCGGN